MQQTGSSRTGTRRQSLRARKPEGQGRGGGGDALLLDLRPRNSLSTVPSTHVTRSSFCSLSPSPALALPLPLPLPFWTAPSTTWCCPRRRSVPAAGRLSGGGEDVVVVVVEAVPCWAAAAVRDLGAQARHQRQRTPESLSPAGDRRPDARGCHGWWGYVREAGGKGVEVGGSRCRPVSPAALGLFGRAHASTLDRHFLCPPSSLTSSARDGLAPAPTDVPVVIRRRQPL